MKLWLVRHAPVLAAPGLCYGVSDLAADPLATQQAAQTLAAQLPVGMVLHHSPLQRCELLAQALQGFRPDLALSSDERLREMGFGAWEGQQWDAIPRAAFDAWTADFTDARPGGQGETVRELMARVAHAWDEARASGADRLWVTHAGVMRAALLLSRGVRLPAQAADWPGDALAFGGLMCLDLGGGQGAQGRHAIGAPLHGLRSDTWLK